jgi:hypothetical protein
MGTSPSLRDATVQDIQLELIRRTSFNDFVGERIYASLLRHRSLWKAVLLDRTGVANYAEAEFLLVGGLIKLRDLPRNTWNADELFILTPTPDDARALAQVAEDEGWGGEVVVYEDRKQTDAALGMGRIEYGLMSIWWD